MNQFFKKQHSKILPAIIKEFIFKLNFKDDFEKEIGFSKLIWFLSQSVSKL